MMKFFKYSLLFNFFLAFASVQGLCAAETTNGGGNSHLQFEGISLDGQPAAFAKALKEKGYVPVNAADSTLLFSDSTANRVPLHGKIAGLDATLMFQASAQTHTVYSLNIVLDKRYKFFTEAKVDYDILKSMLKNNYGPLKSLENISISKDFDTEIKEPGNFWLSSRNTDEGKIYLQIKYSPSSENLFVSLIFMDKENADKSAME